MSDPRAFPKVERRKRRRGIRRVLIIGVLGAGVAAAIVLAVGFSSFREFASANRLREDLLYSSQIRDHLQRIFEDLLSAESGTLGYVVTGREEFLNPLNRIRDTVSPDIEALTKMAWGRPQHQVALAEFARFAEEEMRLLRDMAATRNAAGGLAAANVMEARHGKAVMDRIRNVVNTISAEEVADTETRTYAVRLASQRTKQTLLLLLSAAIAVVAGSSLVMIAHLMGRRRAEMVLADTLARHRAILASAMDVIVTINDKGLIETSNPATVRMFGWTPEELARSSVARLFALDEDETEGELLRRLEGYAVNGGHAQEFAGRRKDGSIVPVDVVIGQMRASDGNRLVAILHDISERKRTEIMKNEFVSTVSHELRTPLTSIAGSLGLLDGGAAGPLPAPAKRLVAIAHQNSRRLVRLINDILDIEKMQSASMTFAHEPVSMEEVTRQAMEQNAGFADEHKVRLAFQSPKTDTTVVGDHDRLIQVLTNLISNAVKFSPPEGTVNLVVARRNEMVRVSVEDHGTGIPLSFRNNIFTRFAQADNTDTRQRGGTGLGLAIVKEIVERHAGRLSFETEEGEGTTFHVDLPARLAEATPEKPHEDAPVLVVESDAGRAAAILKDLSEHGIEAERAETAAECEGRAAIRSCRAILVSPHLRDRDGISLVRSLRRAERTRETPLMLVSLPTDTGDARNTSGGGLMPVADWLELPPERSRLEHLLAGIDTNGGLPTLLHLVTAGEARRTFAKEARGIAEVIAAATIADARAALSMRPCAFLVVDFTDPGLPREELVLLLQQPAGTLPPIVGCSTASHDGEVAHLLDQVIAESRTGLGAVVEILGRARQTPPSQSSTTGVPA